MNPYMHSELTQIAQSGDLACFRALDKLAAAQTSAGYVNAPGSANMGGNMGPPPMPGSSTMSGGMTNMPGMSVHCDKCFCEIKEPTNFCPKCGTKLKKMLDMKQMQKGLKNGKNGEKQVTEHQDDLLETGQTGAEAAENEELAEGAYADTGKYANVIRRLFKKKEPPVLKRLPRGAQDPAAVAALLGSAYTGNEVRKAINQEKRAASRVGSNPILRIRAAAKRKKPSEALAKMNWSQKRFSKPKMARKS